MNIIKPITFEYQLKEKSLMDIYNSKSIDIYANDLKYTNYNNIDINRVTMEDKQYKYPNKDTIEYRINESVNNDNKTLDLSHLNLEQFPKSAEILKNTLKYLFISQNRFTTINDLSCFRNIVVIDICNSNLKKLPILPDKIEELIIRDNHITDLTTLSNLYYLKRLDCSNNLINTIPKIDSLEILICNNNKLTIIPHLPQLIRLVCSKNKLNKIETMKNLIILECEENNINIIENFISLKELYCKKNNIELLKNLHKIEVIHCYDNPIRKIDYFYSLQELICDYKKDLALSKLYNINTSNIYKNNVIIIEFK